MSGLFTKDGWPILLLGVSLGVGFGATYGSEFQPDQFPAIGVGIGVVLGVIGAILLNRYLPKAPAEDASAKPDSH
jgi:xanthine/uracil permease